MDREQLRRTALSRRNHVSDESTGDGKWRCDHCKHGFHSEKVFMNHKCKEGQRNEELKSIIGQTAYSYYSEWMRLKKRTVPAIDVFAESKFYTTFIKFAEHARKVNIPNVPQFIKVMIENGDVSPSLWCRDQVYSMYITWYDTIYPPETQFVESIETIETLIDDYDCKDDPKRIFYEMNIDKLLQLVKKRKLSPWFLLASKSFREFLSSRNAVDKSLLESSLNVGAMIMQIKNKQGLFKMFNEATQEMNL